MSPISATLCIAVTMCGAVSLAVAAGQPVRTAWFEEARFGMFIHWSASSALEGRYCGEPVRQGVYGEWLRARNRVPRADWDAAVATMKITPEKVDAWAEAARDAGMKYIIFVAKHHDGLAFWPSKVSDYTYNKVSGVSFDVIGRLKEACDKRGLKLCFYYSQWQDWEDRNGWGNFWEYNSKDPAQYDAQGNFQYWDGSMYRDNLDSAGFDRYWRAKAMPQVEELIRNYKPAIVWFDCYIPRERTVMTGKQLGDMTAMIRRLDPQCLINSRLPTTKIGGDEGADYETLGDNELGHQRVEHPWESAMTFALSWGYNRDDQNWRPTTYFVRNLVRNISLGGNFVINIGPLADGTIPDEARVRLTEIGRSVNANKEGIRGCGYTPFEEGTQDWGLTTVRRLPDGTSQLYLHVFDWPVDGVVRVNGLKTKVRAACLPATGVSLSFRQAGVSMHVETAGVTPQPYDTVIRLDLEGPADVDNSIIGERNGGDIVMQAAQAACSGVKKERPDGGSTKLPSQLGGWSANDASASWRIAIPAAGKYRVRICYAAALDDAGKEFVISAGKGLDLRGRTVGTHRNRGEFRTFDLGALELPQAGECTLSVSPAGPVNGELFKLLWVCCTAAK
jgi:alpha-L-fucosidase